MGKHGNEYERVARDLYPTLDPWVVEALAEHVDIAGKIVWEPACGEGHLAQSLRAAGAARVYATDIVDYGSNGLFDFASAAEPKVSRRFDLIVTNPGYGQRGKLAEKVLTRRIVWFRRRDGIREAPRENHAWFVWQQSVLRVRHSPIVLYAPKEK
jgi:hypothetical protein